MFASASNLNDSNIVNMIGTLYSGSIPLAWIDLGAGDGRLTKLVAASLPKGSVTDCVEVDTACIRLLEQEGFRVSNADLNSALPFSSESFDFVVANQVIEHLYDTDYFIGEIRRIVRPNGHIIISTENLASWHNVGALMLGWQPFSITNYSVKKSGIGNPLALHLGEAGAPFPMQHHRLFTTNALRELLELHGFRIDFIAGAGYYPFPATVGKLHPNRAHFIAIGATVN